MLAGLALAGAVYVSLPQMGEVTSDPADAPATSLQRPAAVFADIAGDWMPTAQSRPRVTDTWYCPGVPATGEDGVEGIVRLVNWKDEPLSGTMLVVNDNDEPRRVDISIPAYETVEVDLDDMLPGEAVGALVEFEGIGGLVEQVSLHPAGNSSAACLNKTADHWYFADGHTVDGSTNRIILMNPFEQTVVAKLSFSTKSGTFSPPAFAGFTVQPRSVRVLDLGGAGTGAQSEPILGVAVEVRRGRLAAGRFQRFRGGGRLGAQVTVGVPAPREQWYFAEGERASGRTERYVIYNPNTESTTVDVVVLGVETKPTNDPIEVAAGRVEVVSLDEVDIPQGRYATVLASSRPDVPIVVERVVTTNRDGSVGTTVGPGAPPQPDGNLPKRWFIPQAPEAETAAGLVVYNAEFAPVQLAVYAVGASGPVAVPGLESMQVSPASPITIDLTDERVLGRQLIVASEGRVLIERSFPTGRDQHRAVSWAIPITDS